MKKIILLILFTIVFSNFVSASTNDDLVANLVNYWRFEDNLTDSAVGQKDLTASGVTSYGSGKVDNAIWVDNSAYLYNASGTDEGDQAFTFICWANINTSIGASGADPDLFSSLNANEGFEVMRRTTADTGRLRVYQGTGSAYEYTYGSVIADQTWTYIGLMVNSSDGKTYAITNNAFEQDGGSPSASGSHTANTGTFRFGMRLDANSGTYYEGWIDECVIFNRSITQAELDFLYNSGNGRELNLIPSNISEILITARDFWDNGSISNFSAFVNGTYLNTTNGTINTGFYTNQSFVVPINVSSVGFFNSSTIQHNVSGDILFNLSQTDIVVNFTFSSGDLVTTPINFTALDGSGVSFNVTGGSVGIMPSADNISFRVSCDNNVFAPFNWTNVFTALENTTYVLEVNETLSVLTFIDINDSSAIVNASVEVFYPSGASVNLTTNSSGQVNFSYIYNNSLEFGDYTFRFTRLGYIPLNISETINLSNVPFSETYNVSRASIFINVYDRATNSLLTGKNVSVAFVGLFNETITNGVLSKNNLSIVSGEYIIYVGSEGYRAESRTFDFTNQENLTLNFYLLNLSDTNYGNFFVTTRDSFFREVTDASCDLLEYVPSELSFISVSNCVTNINAECSYAVELNIKTYYVRCTSVIGGTIFTAETNTNGEILTGNNEIRDLIFFTRADFSISATTNLIYDITESFVNNVSSISINFFSNDGTAKEVCIEYFRKVSGSWVSVTNDTYCLTSSSAVQNIGASVTLNRSNDYKAEVYVNIDGGGLDTFNYPSSRSMGEVFDNDFKSIIVAILWVLALGVALHQKNITLFFMLAIVVSWLEVAMFPTWTITSISTLKTIISLLGIYVARKKQDLQ